MLVEFVFAFMIFLIPPKCQNGFLAVFAAVKACAERKA
jgi:hypothetical protein